MSLTVHELYMDFIYFCLSLIFGNDFSVYGHVLSDGRKRLIPSSLGSQMILHINKDLLVSWKRRWFNVV